ncbi:hypothetical protein CNQ82_02435 [Staphylococcus debuckii]|nr:hypothetical protein CNQ82_02435 [Staphylococcus debuckii]
MQVQKAQQAKPTLNPLKQKVLHLHKQVRQNKVKLLIQAVCRKAEKTNKLNQQAILKQKASRFQNPLNRHNHHNLVSHLKAIKLQKQAHQNLKLSKTQRLLQVRIILRARRIRNQVKVRPIKNKKILKT